GLYSGLEAKLDDLSFALDVVSKRASERIARFAFSLAHREKRARVTIIHKATVLKLSGGLFRQICFDVARDFREIKTDELMVDTAAYKLVTNPREFHVLLTTNIFGDILSDVGAGVTGGLGLAPSANIGEKYALFEPVHGTGSEIVGRGTANPLAAIFSATMLLHHLGETLAARKLESAAENVLQAGQIVTPDIGGRSSTVAMTNEISRLLRES
ncbi:MAG: isocitrate/isopropylmalate family dehydrogenase, partial [Candidatus Bathyarchaeia archaeon]